ncbi:MAG: hypothetical protein AAF702_06680 [Chloroflexota bacterium]
MTQKLTTRDLITIGIFTAIYLIVYIYLHDPQMKWFDFAALAVMLLLIVGRRWVG